MGDDFDERVPLLSIRVAGVNVEKGHKVRGFLVVGEASSHEVRLPYVVVNGREQGPRLCVLGGVHGLEYASIEAALCLAQQAKPKDLRGALMIVPVVNAEGFHARAAYNNPLDFQNQNRVFPGGPDGSMTRRVAHAVFSEFVSKSDYLIDLHTGDLGEDAVRNVFIWKTDDERLRRAMVDMASCFEVEYAETMTVNGNTGEALRLYGIPSIMTESGTPFPVRESDVAFHQEGVMNVMRHLGMAEGRPRMRRVPLDPPMERIFARFGGIWRRRVEAGQRLKEGAALGEVTSLLGDTLQVAESPFDGVANVVRTFYEVNSGDTLLWMVKA